MIIWADKIAIVWGGVVFVVILWMANNAAAFDDAMLHSDLAFQLVLKLVLPVWLLLRGLDWIAGGPRRRRGY